MREPTILSPFGEGYCRHCRFIVGLGPDGLLDRHCRGRHSRDRYGAELEACKGSNRRPVPPQRVPYWSRRSRFRYEPPMARCPRCGQDAKASTFGGLVDTLYFLRHRSRIRGGFMTCPMTGMPVPAGAEAR